MRVDSVEIRSGSEANESAPAIRMQELLEARKMPTSEGWIVKFHGLPEDLSAYNASDIFMVDEEPHMLVRIEGKRADQEFTSKLAIYRCSSDGRECWPTKISNLPELVEGKITQDPAISYVEGRDGIEGKWVITWVEVTLIDTTDPTKGRTYKSVSYYGSSLNKLEHLVDSPPETKGLRYVGLLDGRIGISTRPDIDGERKVCFTIADSWADVTTEFLAGAQPVKGLSVEDAWAGVNDMELLANGDVNLALHLGQYVENGISGNREYHGAHSVLTPQKNNSAGPANARYLKIIAVAKDFNISIDEAPSKRPDLKDILYTSCVIIARQRGTDATWMGGFRDEHLAGIGIPDPLDEWRTDNPEFADNPFPQSAVQQAHAA